MAGGHGAALARRGAVAWAACAAFLSLTAACSSRSEGNAVSESDDGGALDGSGDVVPTYAPTFTALYGEVITTTCALLFCHGGATDFLPMGTKDMAYAALVGVVSHGPRCGATGLTIVDPGNPGRSLLYLKVTNPPCGNKMPVMYGLLLDPKEIDQIKAWIALGAQNN